MALNTFVVGCRQGLPGGSRWPAILTCCLLCWVAVSGMAQEGMTARQVLGQDGYLVISSARDTTFNFQWLVGVPSERRALVWPAGLLVMPDSVVLDSLAATDLIVRCNAELSGYGARGRLLMKEGVYPVSEPLLLSDGIIELFLTGGELKIQAGRIRYRPPTPPDAKKRDSRAGYVFLAGMVVLVLVLLRRARRQTKQGT